MSSIDNRIVQMQFENSQFERGVSESLKTLDALKKSLDLKDSSKSLSELQKLGDSFSLAKMANGVEQVAQKFSMLGVIGRRIFENLADDAYRAGKRFIASVSTDQITKGWQKYADKTSAVQTIMAATGEDIGEINKQLDKLNWFTDETSYNFVDMINNIGKFTSMGIDLGTSVTAMQGIATWAAVSGAGIQGASRAMYNLSQAIGTGSVKLIDWKSIENANMATKEFKETVIETAKAMGVLTKEGKTKKGTLVTFENFSQTLSEGWFNKDVLLKSLQKYGEYADAVYQVASEKGISAAEAMELVSGETMELGEKAFKAAQEAKTFSEAIDSVKDAVSTGWMNMFENVFGNYEEAKKLWTDLANYLWDIFASPLADTNEILAQWKELGGREKLLKGIYDIFSALKDIITAVGAALGEIFPPITVERLMSLSDAVAEFGANLKSTFGIASYSFDTYHRKHDAILDMYKEENFQLDDRSEKVKEFQRMLVDAGALEEKFANGIFNPATAAAFEKYQKGLDGIKEKLETTLKFGDKGKEVEEFQKKLAELGFDPGAIDGIWGKKTQAAFERYEASLDTVGEKYHELKRGQKGEDVKRLQEALIVAGKLDEGQADGIFGPKTEKALREYQKAQGIRETGILDEETIKALYGEDVQSDIEKTTRTVETYSDTLEKLKNIAKGVFSVFRIGLTIFSFIGSVVGTVLKQFAPLGDALITILSGFGIALGDLSNGLANSEKLQNFLKNLNTWLEPINKWAQKAADGLLSFFGFGKKADGANKSTITFYSIWEKVKKSVEKTGIIKKVAKAWEDLKAVFETIKKPLEDVWNSIKQWFSDRFTSFAESLPDTIGNIASSIGDFIANVFGKIAEWIPKIPGYIEDIKAFFGAFFSPGDEKTGEKQGFGNKVWEFIKSIPGKIADFIQKVPGYAKKIGGVIKELWDSLKLSEKFQSLGPGLTSAWETIKDFFTKLWDAIVGFFETDTSEDKEPGDAIKHRLESFSDLGIWISDKWTGLLDILKGAFEKLKSTFSTLWENIKDAGKWVLIGIGVLLIFKVIYSIAGAFRGAFQMVTSLKGKIQTLSQSLKDIAIAIAIIAGVIVVLSVLETIKPGILTKGLLIVGAIVLFMAAIIAVGATINAKAIKGIGNIGKAMRNLALSIAVMAGVVLILSFIKWDTIVDGLLKAAVVGALLVAFIWILNKVGATKIKYQGLIQLSIAIGILALIAGWMGTWEPETLKQGLKGLLVVMALMAGLIYIIGKTGSQNVKAKGFIGLAVAIGALALVTGYLGALDSGELKQGLIAVAILSALMGALIWLNGKYGKDIKGGQMLLLFAGLAAVILSFAYAINLVKDVDPSILYAFSISLGIALLAFTAACKIAGKDGKWGDTLKGALGIGGALIVFALAIAAIVYGLGWLDTASPGKLEAGGEALKKIADALSPFTDSFDKCLGIAALLFASYLVGKADGGVGDMLSGAIAISGALFILTLAITIIIGGLGYIDDQLSGKLTDSINRGGEVLAAIGTAISKLNDSVNGDLASIIFVLLAILFALSMYGGGKGMTEAALKLDEVIAIVLGGLTIILGTLGTINEWSDGRLEKAIDSAGGVLEAIGRALERFLSGFIQGLIDDVNSFSDAITTLRSSINGMSSSDEFQADLDKAIEAIQQLKGFFDSVGDYAPNPTGIEGYNTAADSLSSDVTHFGQAILALRTGISGVAKQEGFNDDITKAIEAANRLKTEFFDKIQSEMPDGSGLIEYNNKATSLSGHIKQFGLAMHDFRNGVSGISKTDIENDTSNAIGAASAIAQFLSDLNSDPKFKDMETNKSALARFFEGDTKGNTILSMISGLGDSIGNFRDKIGSIGEKDSSFDAAIDSSMTFLTKMTGFLSYLGDETVHLPDVVNYGNTYDNYQNLMSALDNIAARIGTFNEYTKDVDISSFATIISSITDLAKLLSGSGEVKISTDNFLGDLDANAVVEKLTSFTTSLTDSLSGSTEAITSQAQSFNDAGSALTNAVSAGMSSTSVNTSALELSVKTSAETIKGYAKDFAESGRYLSAGLAVGITFNSFLAVQAARLMAQKVIDNVRKMFDQASPSKVFAEIGRYNDEGLANGMTQYSGVVTKAAEGVGQATIDTARSSLASLSSILAEDIDDTPVVRPIVDLTNAREAASSIGGMFHNQSFGVETANLASRASAANAARVAANQNGSKSSSESSVNSTNSAVNLTGNNFYVRSEQDIESLASEIATLNKQQQRSMGAAF